MKRTASWEESRSLRACIPGQYYRQKAKGCKEVNVLFTVLVLTVDSIGLGPPPPKKLLMSDGIAEVCDNT